MKHKHFDLSHHCQSINIVNPRHFPCDSTIHLSRLHNRCGGACFQRSFYPSCIHSRMLHTIVPPCSFHSSCSCETTKIKTKSQHPSSYHVTVRPVTPLHVAMAAAEGYQTRKSRDSIRTTPTTISSHPKLRTSETTNRYEKDQNSPSIPTKKMLPKNNGIQMSSTSFDEQKNTMTDQTSETNSDHTFLHSPALSNVEHSPISKFTSVTSDKHIHSSINKQPITQQIEAQHPLQSSSDNRHPNIDKDESTSIKFLPNELETSQSPSNIDHSHFPILPSSFAPNINQIKSNEMLVHFSRSNKSNPTINYVRQKSMTNLTKSNTSLRTTRSTIDFGFLIHETST